MVGNEAFAEVVLNGMLLPNGMPQFDDRLTEEDVVAIQHFILLKVAGAKMEN